MKSPFNVNQNQQFLQQKPLPNSNTARNTASNTINITPSCCSEPTSIGLRGSPSPSPAAVRVSDAVSGVQTVSGLLTEEPPPLQWDDQPPLLSSDDWDSLIGELGEKDVDTAPTFKSLPQFGPCESQTPNLPHSTTFDPFDPSLVCYSDSNLTPLSSNPHINRLSISNSNPIPDFNLPNNLYHLQIAGEPNFEFDCLHLDQLIRAAECIESEELQPALVILARLNHRLQSPTGKPLQRAAFYFKEALQSVVSSLNRTNQPSSADIVQKIKAYKAFCEISPIALFANFTANQALLEALDGSMFIHVIDFEIGLGGQWASFMQEIASKSKHRNVSPSALRITAIITEDSTIESNLIKDNLYQFAQEVGVRFQIEFVPLRNFEILSFNSIRFINGEMIAVNLSPSILRHFSASDSVTGFLRMLRRISPRIIVFVDGESWRDAGAPSFRQTFINGLEFYSTLLESLDSANTGGIDLMRRIERFLLRPKILAAISAAAGGYSSRNRPSPWWVMLSGAGMVPMTLSKFTEYQADFLVQRPQFSGFHLAERQAMMLLCWKEREIVATSAWRC